MSQAGTRSFRSPYFLLAAWAFTNIEAQIMGCAAYFLLAAWAFTNIEAQIMGCAA